MENTKSKSAKSKTHKSKIKGKKKETKRKDKKGKKWKKKGLVHLHFCCFFFAFSICFFFAFVLLFVCLFFAFCLEKSKKKQNKSKSKKHKKGNKNANGQVPFFSHFSPFLTFLFFPIYFASCFFFGFEVLLFDFPCVFLFLAFFSSLKNIRISYRGGHKSKKQNII